MVPGHYENGIWYPDDPKLRRMLDKQHMLQPQEPIEWPQWLRRIWQWARSHRKAGV